MVQRIAAIYAIEERIRGGTAEQRRSVREAESRPLMDDLKQRLTALLEELSVKSTLAKAIRYTLGHWDGLTMFLTDGRVEIDSNTVERTMRCNRPHTSNDNPFSESHFKTLKYQPRFPRRFGCIEDAKSFCRRFFDWYNQDHHHAEIGLMTPDQVHYGQIDAVHAARQVTLDQAFRDYPERFVNKAPIPPDKLTATWINPPTPKVA